MPQPLAVSPAKTIEVLKIPINAIAPNSIFDFLIMIFLSLTLIYGFLSILTHNVSLEYILNVVE
jgi:hypothetical protein